VVSFLQDRDFNPIELGHIFESHYVSVITGIIEPVQVDNAGDQ
jgi:hypothetical protein